MLLWSNKRGETAPKKSCDSIWAADYPAAVKVQPPWGNICKGIKVIRILQKESQIESI